VNLNTAKGEKMTRKLSRTLWLALALPAILTSAIVLSTPRRAHSQYCDPRSRCGNDFYYYSDPGLTNLVGVRSWDCDCNYSGWGTIDDYQEILPAFCCD
jgi:hypothetical protein